MLNANNNYFFTPSFLYQEMQRLFSLFVPRETLGSIPVMVEETSGCGNAAVSKFDPNVVIMYRDYHLLYPEDYKITLLHEAGHFVFSKDHSDFETYYNYLKLNQEFISEQVIPDTYEEFLYCKSGLCGDYRFVCSSCRSSKKRNSSFSVKCGKCHTNMLLVSGI
tara:strand:- start:67 stop:558 length:492 start_codon:yes stop_codon:yes gene_type:complete